jgi:hypothetical protein
MQVHRAVQLFAVLLLAGCGVVPTATGSDPSAPRTASPPLPSLSPDPTAGWKSYTSTKWGYTIKYPSSWIDLSNLGGTDSEQYFANEKVGSSNYMSDKGIFVAILVFRMPGNPGRGEPLDANQCLRHDIGGVTLARQSNVNVDGLTSNINAIGTVGRSELVVNLVKGANCYWFQYFFHSVQLRDITEPTVQLMLGKTFHFGVAATTITAS